jgi:TRAP transporter TAXI family solute receptor
MAYRGTGLYKGKPLTELRSVTRLWPDAVHYLIRCDARKSGTIEDLSGLTVATGLSESGNRFTTELLLRSQKSLHEAIKLRTMSDLAAAEALRNGTIQALNITGGIPVPLVAKLFSEAAPPIELLEVPEECVLTLKNAGWKHVFRTMIPADTYLGQDRPVNTVGFENMLATTASLDPQVVYALTKTLYENLDYLVAVHPACRSVTLDSAIAGLDVPLHRGAAQYYRERNIAIPQHLVD